MGNRIVEAVLFDLDGTLVDSAPDLLDVLGRMRADRGLQPVDYSARAHMANRGAAGLLAMGFDANPEIDQAELRREFLDLYRAQCFRLSCLYDGVQALLEQLGELGIPWGVVTNKPGDLAREVMAQSGWLERCACLVGGDTLPVAKPDPAPVRRALETIGAPPDRTLMIGDDPRDIQAGRAAGTVTAAAGWGYLEPGVDVSVFEADHVVSRPLEVLELISIGQHGAGRAS